MVFFILGMTTVGFLIPKFRPDLVALSSLLTLQLTGILTLQESLTGFANSVVIMIAALFIVGEGILQTGLAQQAGNMLVKWTGNSELRVTMFMLTLVAILSGFISNTGTVAILLPVVVSLSRQMQLHPGKLLMPLAFASSMGGALTLIGTAPNLIARQSLIDHGYPGLRFFAFTPIGLVILLAGIAYLWFFGRRWLDKPLEKEKKLTGVFDGEDLLEQYRIENFIHPVLVPADNSIVGKTLRELYWPSKFGVTVLEIVKKEGESRLRLPFSPVSRRLTAGPNYTVDAGDVLLVFTEVEKLNSWVEKTGLEKVQATLSKEYRPEESKMAEVILTPNSRLINTSIEDIHFREKYGLTILALKRQYKGSKRPSPDAELAYGDAMLVHGKWEDIDLLAQEKNDMVVLKHAVEPAKQNQPMRAAIAGLILLSMLVMLVLEWLPAVTTVIFAALLMLLSGSIRHADQAYRSVNWQTVVLIASMLPMATALEKTGGVKFLSEGLISVLGAFGPMVVLGGLYAITSLLSQFISNTATAVLLFPVAILTAQQMGVSPVPMVMAVAYSATMAFATPVATPPNAMVMAAGNYTFFDFVRVGVPLQIFIALITVFILTLFFPF